MNWYLFTARITSQHFTPVTETGTVQAEDECQAEQLVDDALEAEYGETARRIDVRIHRMIKKEAAA